MRTSVLARSIVTATALAVGSAALAAVPATAATPSGITRDMVLTAATGMRTAYATPGGTPTPATQQAVRAILNRACTVDADAGEFLFPGTINALPLQSGSSADGLAVGGQIINFQTGAARWCLAGVVTSTTPGFDLSGSMTLTGTPSGGPALTVTTALSGDTAATPPLVAATGFVGFPTFTAAGASTRTVYVPAKTVKDKKSKAEKKAAKKKYEKRLKAATKKYARALGKAGSSKAKKTAAKKAYSADRKSAKAKYRYATANYRIVKKATTARDVRPFSLSLVTY